MGQIDMTFDRRFSLDVEILCADDEWSGLNTVPYLTRWDEASSSSCF